MKYLKVNNITIKFIKYKYYVYYVKILLACLQSKTKHDHKALQDVDQA